MPNCFRCGYPVTDGYDVKTINGQDVKLCLGCWVLYSLYHLQEAARE